MCFVHSCVWSSTSSRRRSDGCGSFSTRETYASHSWSWRWRTWKTPSLTRAHFETCPPRSHFHPLVDHMHYCTNALTPSSNHRTSALSHSLHRGDLHLYFMFPFCLFLTRCTYFLFMHTHSDSDSHPAVIQSKTLCTCFFCTLHSYASLF